MKNGINSYFHFTEQLEEEIKAEIKPFPEC